MKPSGELIEENKTTVLSEPDQDRFQSIFDLYFERVFRYLFSRTNNRQAAEDLAGQVFLKILEALPRYQNRRPIAAWIFTIARNSLFSYYRAAFRHPLQSMESAGLVESLHAGGSFDRVVDLESYIDLEKSLHELPSNERELLRLRYAASLSFLEIGVLQRKSPEAVKMALHRTLRKLGRKMELEK